MSPAQRGKLQAAAALIFERTRSGVSDAAILNELVMDHGATVQTRREPYSLRIAGVTSSCTWSRDAGLLANWSVTANLRLARDAGAGA